MTASSEQQLPATSGIHGLRHILGEGTNTDFHNLIEYPRRFTMKRLLLSLILATAACASNPMGPATEESLEGTWVLKSVNGQALPWVLDEYGYRMIVRYEELTFRNSPPGSCQWVSSYRFESTSSSYPYFEDEPASVNDDCSWILFASEVIINNELVGVATGNILTLREDEYALVYHKK